MTSSASLEVSKLEFQLKQHREQEEMEDMTRRRWCSSQVGHMHQSYWQIFIIMLAVYNAIALPLQIAFVEVQNQYDNTASLEVLEILVDVFFILDIFVVFLSAYIDTADGETVQSPKKIAKHYLGNGFWTDFISSTPLFLRLIINATTESGSDLQQNLSQSVTVLRLLKLLRVRRLSTLIANLQQPM